MSTDPPRTQDSATATKPKRPTRGTRAPAQAEKQPKGKRASELRESAVRGAPASSPATTPPKRPERSVANTDLYRRIVELSPDAIVVTDAKGRILLINRQAEALFGYAPEQLLGQSVDILVPDAQRESHAHHRGRYQAAPRARPMGMGLALSGRRRDGTTVPVEISLSPIHDADGPVRVMASIRDVSERRELERARASAEAAVEELRRVQSITDVALAHQDSLDVLLTNLLSRIAAVMDADSIVILLVDASGQMLNVRAATGLQEVAAAQVRVPVGQGLAGRIAASRAPLVVDDLRTFPVINLFLREQLRSALGVPLLVEDRLIGVLHIGSVTPRRFTERETRLLQLAAERIALAIDRARLHENERQAHEETQAALATARESELRFQRLVEAGIIGMIVADGKHVLEANDAFLRLVGYTREDMASGVLDRVALTPPEDIAATTQAIAEALARGACEPFEKEYLHHDGHRVPVLVGIVRLEREPLRLVSFIVDLTERKRLERTAQERARQLEAILAAMTDGLVVYDAHGHITRMNTAARDMFAVDALPGYTELSLDERARWFAPRDATGVLLPRDAWPQSRVLQGEVLFGSYADEMLVRGLDGHDRRVSVTGGPLRDGVGNVSGAVLAFRDVSEQKRLEREREEAQARELATLEVNRQLDQFFATAAHDIRNPVTVVRGNLDLATRQLDRLQAAISHSDSAVADAVMASGGALGEAVASADRLTRLVALLFDVARARSGTLEMRLAPCDLAALVREQVTAARVAAPERRILLEASPTDEAVPVLGDADRLGQVLANYVTNALKYSADDAQVTVGLEVTDGLAVVWVRDEGPGLAWEEQTRIWELFHRAPGVTTKSHIGGVTGSLGLGLHICKQVIEMHPGGRVGVDSTIGDGSTFWFRLPVAANW